MGRSGCRGHARHWFTVYGCPGFRAPRCMRCGAPNPRPLTAQEQDNYEALTHPPAVAGAKADQITPLGAK